MIDSLLQSFNIAHGTTWQHNCRTSVDPAKLGYRSNAVSRLYSLTLLGHIYLRITREAFRTQSKNNGGMDEEATCDVRSEARALTSTLVNNA